MKDSCNLECFPMETKQRLGSGNKILDPPTPTMRMPCLAKTFVPKITTIYLMVFAIGLSLGVLLSEYICLKLTKDDVPITKRNLLTVPGWEKSRLVIRSGTKKPTKGSHPVGKLASPDRKSPQTRQASQIVLQDALFKQKDILYENLPHSNPVANKRLPRIYRTSKSIAGCLFIMDDTIRLLEWLAYHYTVLPLSHLMVAIDPNSRKADRIMEILTSWEGKIAIKAYRNDTEWLDLPWDYGYTRSIRNPDGQLMKWFSDKSSDVYVSQVHKRRQNYFCVHCMRYMKEKGMDWTIITDSDEFLMFNYKHGKQEDSSLYDALKRGVNKEDINKERMKMSKFRDRLPAMELRATIADYIHQEKLKKKCIMFPGLQFTSYESKREDVFKGIPAGVNPYHLVTLRHRKAGRREGSFSKTMIDVSQGLMEDYSMDTNFNVHIPNKLLCGINGNTGSGKDYISSLFRLHHYRTGTWESFIERAADRRANMTVERFLERNIEPKVIDDDIRPWINWFIEKVGMDEARRLLIEPLADAYNEYNHDQINLRL